MEKIIQYKKFGRCLELSNNNIKCIITLDKGPRIIYYGKDENLLYEDIDDKINKKREDLNLKDNTWHIFGGHRIWKSPEQEDTYYPDNNKVIYEKKDDYLVFYSEKEEDTKLKKYLCVKLNNDGSLDIKNILERENLEKSEATWSLTVLKPEGKIFIPFSQKDTGYLPNRSINLWSYSDINDKRLKIENSGIKINIEKENIAKKEPLKIGTFSTERKVYYLKDNLLLEFELISEEENNFPDYNSNIEVYTINKMVEIEFLTSLKNNAKKIELCQRWNIYNKDTDLYKDIKNKI